jgi:hypothetical protein
MSMEWSTDASDFGGYRRALEMVNANLSPNGKPPAESWPTYKAGTKQSASGLPGTTVTTKPPPPRGYRSGLIARVLRPPVHLLASVSSILILLVALAVLMQAR